MLIGFGSTEEEVENEEFERIAEFAKSEFSRLECSYVTDELVKAVTEFVKQREKELKALAEQYKAAEEYPSRYSYFWPTILHDASHIVCILSFLHINRRHALSPDGWAALSTEPCRVVFHGV